MIIFETTLFGILAGAIGAFLMNMILRWISSSFAQPFNMVEVIGSLFTGKRENSILMGTVIHLIAGAAFGIIYAWVLQLIGATTVLTALFAGMGFGFLHGLLAAYSLMVFVGERHPVVAFRKATLQVGFFYLIGHSLYGGFVGATTGLLTVIFAS